MAPLRSATALAVFLAPVAALQTILEPAGSLGDGDKAIMCSNAAACEVTCQGKRSCRKDIITCPTNYDCKIDCGGTAPEGSCDSTTINCPTLPGTKCIIVGGGGKDNMEDIIVNAGGSTLTCYGPCGGDDCPSAYCTGTQSEGMAIVLADKPTDATPPPTAQPTPPPTAQSTPPPAAQPTPPPAVPDYVPDYVPPVPPYQDYVPDYVPDYVTPPAAQPGTPPAVPDYVPDYVPPVPPYQDYVPDYVPDYVTPPASGCSATAQCAGVTSVESCRLCAHCTWVEPYSSRSDLDAGCHESAALKITCPSKHRIEVVTTTKEDCKRRAEDCVREGTCESARFDAKDGECQLCARVSKAEVNSNQYGSDDRYHAFAAQRDTKASPPVKGAAAAVAGAVAALAALCTATAIFVSRRRMQEQAEAQRQETAEHSSQDEPSCEYAKSLSSGDRKLAANTVDV